MDTRQMFLDSDDDGLQPRLRLRDDVLESNICEMCRVLPSHRTVLSDNGPRQVCPMCSLDYPPSVHFDVAPHVGGAPSRPSADVHHTGDSNTMATSTAPTADALVETVKQVIADLKKKPPSPAQLATMRETYNRAYFTLQLQLRDLGAEADTAFRDAETDPVRRLEDAARVDDLSRRLIGRGRRYGGKVAGEMVAAEEIGRRLLTGEISFQTAYAAAGTLEELPRQPGTVRW
jgi:hypothetical protein